MRRDANAIIVSHAPAQRARGIEVCENTICERGELANSGQVKRFISRDSGGGESGRHVISELNY